MSKQDQAAKAIKFGAARDYTPEQIATLLNKFNLLVPDLPDPDEEGRFIVGQRAIWVDSSGVLCIELRGLGGHVATDGAAIPIGEAAEARELALALLAAANYQEKA